MKRPRYAVGDPLAAEDLQTEQRYLMQRLRRHNRHLHGRGVLCGLRVVPEKNYRRPWMVRVCPGYAIGPYGDEIVVPSSVAVDISDYLWARPIGGGQPAPVAYVGIRYAELSERPIPAQPPSCGCDDTIYKPSRIRDGFQVDILWAPTETDSKEGFDLCKPDLASCPKCPERPYVTLARVTLPASEGDPITVEHIENWT